MDALKEFLPDYAKDVRLNLSAATKSDHLSEQQLWGTLLACAAACREGRLLRHLDQEAHGHLSPEAHQAALSAAAVMGMNNVYYRFLHLASNKEYGSMPARLRMQVIGNPGVDKADFELWCLAVSAINGCGMCIDSHEKVVRQAGVSTHAIQDAVRIASIVHSAAAVLETERLRSGAEAI
ncbi:MAG: carboxymuconolactone decarboxylase family protein [Planctomycetota bacterium]